MQFQLLLSSCLLLLPIGMETPSFAKTGPSETSNEERRPKISITRGMDMAAKEILREILIARYGMFFASASILKDIARSALIGAVILPKGGLGPPRGGEPIVSYVDRMEVNRYYDLRGNLHFEQVILWDWYPGMKERHVVSYKIVRENVWIRPRKKKIRVRWRKKSDRIVDREYYVSTFFDGKILREVRANDILRTWTTFDRELEDREFVPVEKRRRLPKVRKVFTQDAGTENETDFWEFFP